LNGDASAGGNRVAPVIEVDPAATERRIAGLRGYVDRELLSDKGFVCGNFKECQESRQTGDSFREGTMSHVGDRYDLTIDGRPLRIVVVGQESGMPKGPEALELSRSVSLDARRHAIHDISGLQRRFKAEPGYAGRNPHMRGTTSALRVIVGKGLGRRHEDEFGRPANGEPFHIFDGFALVNRLLCSAGPSGTSAGHPTRVMFENCDRHFRATLSILEPTIVILQGAKVVRWTSGMFERSRSYSEYLHESRLDDKRVLLCTFSHPSARGALRWGNADSPYLTDAVVPTLESAVGRLRD